MAGTVERFFVGVTLVAVAATLVTSPYTAGIFTSLFKGIGGVYTAAKH